MVKKDCVKNIQIYYTSFNKPFDNTLFDSLIFKLPDSMQKKVRAFRKWQNQHESLLGKLLLMHGLIENGYNYEIINDIIYNDYGRPYINANIDFNISHSGNCIVCAIAKDLKLGIDIEEIKYNDLSDYKIAMTDEQWQNIFESPSPHSKFFKYWTIKESVIKAEGKGMSIPLNELSILGNIASYGSNKWYLYPVIIDRKFSCTLASSYSYCEVTVNEKIF